MRSLNTLYLTRSLRHGFLAFTTTADSSALHRTRSKAEGSRARELAPSRERLGSVSSISQVTSAKQNMRPRMKREILNDVLSRKTDKPLYHYTGQRGLLGIIGGKQIWATHTSYLNDRREFMHAVDLVYEEINELLASSDHATRSILQEMKNGISGIESKNVCVCSF